MKLLTVKDVAEMLKFSQSTIYAWAETGRIPTICLNGSWRFDSGHLQEWIVENSREGNTPSKDKSGSKKSAISTSERKEYVEEIVDEAIDSVIGSTYTPN